MYTQMFRILRVVIPAVLLSTAAALGGPTNVINLTVQGHLTDASGADLPDGSYNISVYKIDQQGVSTPAGEYTIQVIDGLFSVILNDIPASFFDCPNPNLPCDQQIEVLFVGSGVFLPRITLSDAGRAGRASGVNGDVNTYPSQLEFPPSDPSNPLQTAVITNHGTTFNDINGNPAFEVNTETSTFNVASSMTADFDGPTNVNSLFAVNSDDDATPNLQIGGGLVRGDGRISWYIGTDITPRLSINQVGTMLIDPNGDQPGYIICTAGLVNLNRTAETFDLDGNSLDDVRFNTDGSIDFNCDLTGGTDYSFTGTGCSVGKQCSFTDNVTCNPGGGVNPELAVNTNSVTCKAAFSADPDVDAVNEFEVGNNIAAVKGEFRVDAGSTGLSNLVVQDGDYRCDADGDGEFEIYARVIGGQMFTGLSGDQVKIDVPGGVSGDVTITGGDKVIVTVNGNLIVTGSKGFVQQHPTNLTQEIVYICLEGGEAGTYSRGSSIMENGIAVVELPEHFALVTNLNGLTVQITPRGPVQSMLYVESVTPSQLVVKASNPADANVPFDFMINGLRKGFEDHQVIRDKQVLAATR